MEYRRLGRTALRVSPLCLGTMNFGPLTTEPDSFAIMDRALELGINFFDTANRYGGPKGPGTTETIIGNWFAQGGGRREKVVLATKVFGADDRLAERRRPLGAAHPRACDASLRRLQTDHIDLYQMHHIDRTAPWDEVWQAMETLVAPGQGPLRRQQQLRRLAHRAGERGRQGPALPRARERAEPLQPRVAHRRARGAARRVAYYGLGVIPWSPLAGGMLGGNLHARPTPRAARACNRATSGCGPQLERGRSSAPTSARSRPPSRSRGCSTKRA